MVKEPALGIRPLGRLVVILLLVSLLYVLVVMVIWSSVLGAVLEGMAVMVWERRPGVRVYDLSCRPAAQLSDVAPNEKT